MAMTLRLGLCWLSLRWFAWWHRHHCIREENSGILFSRFDMRSPIDLRCTRENARWSMLLTRRTWLEYQRRQWWRAAHEWMAWPGHHDQREASRPTFSDYGVP